MGLRKPVVTPPGFSKEELEGFYLDVPTFYYQIRGQSKYCRLFRSVWDV